MTYDAVFAGVLHKADTAVFGGRAMELNGLSDLYNEVSRRTDTDGTKINVAETARCCASLFSVLAECEVDDALRLIARGLEVAKGKTCS